MQNRYPKRLIEVDLPIKRISAHARSEKSRDGHISGLHIWWARRPLAACRSVICAALWFDPADENCPELFRKIAREKMLAWASEHRALLSVESYSHFDEIHKRPELLNDNEKLRVLLFDFIADFARWENASNSTFLTTVRELVAAAYRCGGNGSMPLVVDPFAGGGSIPLEALRVGTEAFASDLNPVAVLLNKVLLELVPKYGHELATKVRKYAKQLKQETEKQLAEFYPQDKDGSIPITYIWARTIRCEGPGCGAEIPIVRSLWIDEGRRFAFDFVLDRKNKTISPRVRQNARTAESGTAKRSSVTCPLCDYTTKRKNVEAQAKSAGLGNMLMAVATEGSKGRSYRVPTSEELRVCELAAKRITNSHFKEYVPNEALPYLRSIFNVHVYGMQTWASLFSPRQLLYLSTLVQVLQRFDFARSGLSSDEIRAIKTVLALIISKSAMMNCNVARWREDRGRLEGAFAMQALPMVWDWAELNPFNKSSAVFEDLVDSVTSVIEKNASLQLRPATVHAGSAVELPLPDDSAALVFTDPPYYDAIPYANLSDFFYVWLKRLLKDDYPDLFSEPETPKANEIVQLAERNVLYAHKTRDFFENEMQRAMLDARRVAEPTGLACIVFAHKTTAGWEALINAVLGGGWMVTASWPIDTELTTRFKAIGTASLSSSIHLVCRPREREDGSLEEHTIGEWRDVLEELPHRIHEWMPRLAHEGVVGADAIFACLGPALEIFSRYSRVEKVNGEGVTLKEFLEHVWAAVAREALAMVFEGADATGFEADARLTAMWLWTLSTSSQTNNAADNKEAEAEGQEEKTSDSGLSTNSILEFDPANRLAMGIGAQLEKMTTIVEIKDDKARLLPVAERMHYLFGKDETEPSVKRRKKDAQGKLFDVAAELETQADGWGTKSAPKLGNTILDRVHQSMILFAAGRGEALKRFLVDDGAGRDERFWRLAQALVALYPKGTDERRWIEGVTGRKKGLGF